MVSKGFWDTLEADKHGIVPIIHCRPSTLVFFKVKVLRKPELPLCRGYCCEGDTCSLILFFTRSILLATVYAVGVPGQGSGWNQARQGPASLQKAPAQDARQATIQPDSRGTEFGPPGVWRHPTGGETRTLRKEPSADCMQALAVAATACLSCRAAVKESVACHRLPLKWS